MYNVIYSIIGILIPFLGTTFGSAFVFFIKKNINEKYKKMIIGFASGVMIAASIWSLIIPSIDMEGGSWYKASIGLFLGIMFLILINKLADYISNKNSKKKLNMLMFSVTLHNIPEGMAVGVCFAAVLSGNTSVAMGAAFVLSIGIAIQNIPEGAIISMPLSMNGEKKFKAFLLGSLSGIVEPIAAFLTLLLLNIVVPVLPYLLSFAAGAMIYVVVEELIPEMHEGTKSQIGIIGLSLGFIVMMILDVLLG